uniref:Uncharacterized protein LOC111123409 isoform X1 n=2 Tax=Crassostrea virginica TaxID=6565 RepID=A0A8B8D0V4_CRAVI|nr:uncharacterized protein LOC111123409 isoform X1 [Crassostrea virginica]XP_022321416.1 uncharacterized protein LOC111123409 isoform X1 [Crassostrea virginica]
MRSARAFSVTSHRNIGMAFPKLREFMGEVQKFLQSDVKPFHMSSILPRGAKRELDSAVPMIAGFRPSRVYYMFAVLNYAEFGSWEEVKMNAPQALEEYQQFMKELPDDERDKPPTPLPAKDTIISQGFPQNSSARFHTSNEDLQYYSPRGPEQNARETSRSSQRLPHDATGGKGTSSVPSGPPVYDVNGYRDHGRGSSRPSDWRSHDKLDPEGQDRNNEILKNDIASSISKLKNELGSLKDRLSQELDHDSGVDKLQVNHRS